MLVIRVGSKSGAIGRTGRRVLARSGRAGALGPFWAVLAGLSLAACSTMTFQGEPPLRHLTASLRVSHSLEMSRLSYQDACGNRREVALGLALRDALQETVAGIFAPGEAPGGAAPPDAADRVLEVELETGELILFVEQGSARRYPADVSLAVSVTAYDASGSLLERHQLDANVSGSVSTEGERCMVRGAEQVAAEAVETLAEELGRYLRGSQSIAMGTIAEEGPAPPVALSFRARVLDADGNQVLEGQEEMTLEVEVTNLGTGPARDVRALVSGSDELMRQLPPVILFGDLQPGESRRQTVTATLGEVAAAVRAELVVSLRSRSVLRQRPASKKFLIILQPKHTAGWRPLRGRGDRVQPQMLRNEGGERGNHVDSAKGS